MTSERVSGWAAVDARARTAKRAVFAETRRRLKLLREKIRNSGVAVVNISAKQWRRAGWVRARVHKQVHEIGETKKRVDTYRAEWRVERDIARVASGSDPIIVGPWLSETGFELLYWIPFLAWARAYGNLDPSQLVVISRGGAASWYRDITTNYEDVLSFYSPDEFRARNDARIIEQRGRLKHVEICSFDREIIEKVTEKRGLSGARLLHPSAMYRLFDHFWFQRVPITLIEAFSSFGGMPPVELGALRERLPKRYVAAKFYGNVALPPTPENRQFVTSYLTDLASRVDVVVLNTSQRFDDHDDFPPSLRGRLHSIDHLMTPENNLAVQTEVIRGARGFVGTYGAFSYLAPLLGVDTVAFYSHPTGFRFDHLEVAKRVFTGLRCGAFVELETRALDVVRLACSPALRALIESR